MQHSTPSGSRHFTQTQLEFTYQQKSLENHFVKKPRPIIIEKLITNPHAGISPVVENIFLPSGKLYAF